MMGIYILKGHIPVQTDDLKEWSEWFDKCDRTVKITDMRIWFNRVVVSTVFLSLDHNYHKDGDPILFETMIFGGKHDQYCNRYSTWAEAEAGHDKIVCALDIRVKLHNIIRWVLDIVDFIRDSEDTSLRTRLRMWWAIRPNINNIFE